MPNYHLTKVKKLHFSETASAWINTREVLVSCFVYEFTKQNSFQRETSRFDSKAALD